MSPQPNFFIVGAAKAGTTALYHYLQQHPDVFMSPLKEPMFFLPEFRVERLSERWQRQIREDAAAFAVHLDAPVAGRLPRGIVRDWGDYLKLFRRARPGQAVGEASTAYLWSPTSARMIVERIPDARFIAILRDPADRAFSQYLHAQSTGNVPESFGELIRQPQRDGPYHGMNPFLEFGMYGLQVERLRAAVQPDRLRIIMYDDFLRDREGTVRDIFRFLGVPPDASLEISRRHNEPRVPRFPGLEWGLLRPVVGLLRQLVPDTVVRAADRFRFRPRRSLVMRPEDRRFLVNYYESDIRRLAAMIERDLSAWLC